MEKEKNLDTNKENIKDIDDILLKLIFLTESIQQNPDVLQMEDASMGFNLLMDEVIEQLLESVKRC